MSVSYSDQSIVDCNFESDSFCLSINPKSKVSVNLQQEKCAANSNYQKRFYDKWCSFFTFDEPEIGLTFDCLYYQLFLVQDETAMSDPHICGWKLHILGKKIVQVDTSNTR